MKCKFLARSDKEKETATLVAVMCNTDCYDAICLHIHLHISNHWELSNMIGKVKTPAHSYQKHLSRLSDLFSLQTSRFGDYGAARVGIPPLEPLLDIHKCFRQPTENEICHQSAYCSIILAKKKRNLNEMERSTKETLGTTFSMIIPLTYQ